MADADLGAERTELSDVLDVAFEADRLGLHTSIPAVVVSYNRTAGTVVVTIPVDRLIPDGNGNLVNEPYPALQDVPIAWPRCRAFAITFPLVEGDTGQLMICERSIAAWRAGKVGHPGDAGMHTLDGAVFYPGLSDAANAPTHTDVTNMVLGSETNGAGRIEILPAGLHLGAGATKGVILSGDTVAAGTTMATWIARVTAQLTTAGILAITGGSAPVAPTDFGVNGSGSASTKSV